MAGLRKVHVAVISGSVAAALIGILAYSLMNTQFDLIMPDGSEVQNATLGPDNFSRLKQNVGVFTVYRPHATTLNPTIGYCPIAEFIHEHEDGYNATRVGNTTIFNATLPPQWCDPELNPSPVPEFAEIVTPVALMGSTLFVVVLSRCRTPQ